MVTQPPTLALDRALLLRRPLVVVAFVISQALFDRDFSEAIPSVIMRLQDSHRQLDSFTTRDETRADQPLAALAAQFCNRCAFARPNDMAIRISMMRHLSV